MMMCWHFEGEGWKVETLSKYCCKILHIIKKLKNFFGNYGLISFNTAPTPQNLFLMIIEKHILIIWNVLYNSSSNSNSVLLRPTQRWVRSASRRGVYTIAIKVWYKTFFCSCFINISFKTLYEISKVSILNYVGYLKHPWGGEGESKLQKPCPPKMFALNMVSIA